MSDKIKFGINYYGTPYVKSEQLWLAPTTKIGELKKLSKFKGKTVGAPVLGLPPEWLSGITWVREKRKRGVDRFASVGENTAGDANDEKLVQV